MRPSGLYLLFTVTLRYYAALPQERTTIPTGWEAGRFVEDRNLYFLLGYELQTVQRVPRAQTITLVTYLGGTQFES